MKLSERLYRLLLRLYSPALRAAHGEDMTRAYRRMVDDARVAGVRWPIARLWCRLLADLVVSLPADRMPWSARAIVRRPVPVPYQRETTMAMWVQDVRFALRLLRRQPMFLFVATLTVGIGVSATTTTFSVANALLFRAPGGVVDADRLVTVHQLAEDGSSFHAFSFPHYRFMASADGVAALAAFDQFEGGLRIDGSVVRVGAMAVSGNYLEMLGVRPRVGRLLRAADDEVPGRDPVVVLGHRLWSRRFGGSPDVIGQQLLFNGVGLTVVGVAESDFLGHFAGFSTDLWVPLTAHGLVRGSTDLSEENASAGLELIGRLAPGGSPAQAREALNAAGAAFAEARGRDWHGVDVLGYSPVFAPARDALTAFLAALFVVAGVLLGVTAVNVANMLLSRGVARASEIGVRLAVGATRGRLVRQLVTESAVLFAIGGALGILFTFWFTRLIAGFSLPVLASLDLNVDPDLRVLGFALGVAGLTGLVFGLSPAFHATRGDLVTALKDGSAGGRRGHRLRDVMIFAQVAGTVVLLISAGLLVRSLGMAGSADLGLDPRDITVVLTDTSGAGRSADESWRYFSDLLVMARQTTGVDAAALVDVLPLTLSNRQVRFSIPGQGGDDDGRMAESASVSPGYFETLRIPLLAGRGFIDADSAQAGVVVVNETLARSAWPGQDPIGQHLQLGGTDQAATVDVVGLARDSRIRSISDPPRPLVYSPSTADGQSDLILLVRASEPGPLSALRERIAARDPVLPPAALVPYGEMIGLSMLPSRFAAGLAVAFGAFGMLLAAIGLHGLLAHAVVQRSREIAIRMALGAERQQVRWLLVGHALRLTAAGLVVGLTLGALVARLLGGLLYGVGPFDPVTYIAISAVVIAVATLASWWPARAATRVQPASVLRGQ